MKKLYFFRDDLFCYLALCIAANKKEAKKIFEKNGITRKGECIIEAEIKNGFCIEGGGNG